MKIVDNSLNYRVKSNTNLNKLQRSANSVSFQSTPDIFIKVKNMHLLDAKWKRFIKSDNNWKLVQEYSEKLNSEDLKTHARSQEIMSYIPESLQPRFIKESIKNREADDFCECFTSFNSTKSHNVKTFFAGIKERFKNIFTDKH